MSDKGKIVLDENLVDEIAAKYSEAEEKVIKIIEEIAKAKTCFDDNYQGGATPITGELLEKMNRHLELLQEYCKNTREFIIFRKEELLKIEDTMKASVIPGYYW